jgi:16S rRNA (adenine1518-N6/adenine1519-N6)-dimethyltransferase
MSLREETKSLLRSHRIRSRKFLGQNFMIEPSIFPRMVSYASLGRSDTVLDVGAGMGFLTQFMAERCGTVIAVEADAELVRILQEQLADARNVKVIEGDIFKTRVPPFNKVVSSPPYYISSRLLLWLFKRGFDTAVLVLQKEFANRLVASVGDEDYGWLTVFAYYHAETSLLDVVPKCMFYPQPEVDSVVVRLESRKFPLATKNEVEFRHFIQSLFTRRNRKVRGAVSSYLEKVRGTSGENVAKLIGALPFSDRRVRHLSPEDFGELANVALR